MTRITYYVKAVPEQFDLWKRRNNYWGKFTIWERLKSNEVNDVLKTHKYTLKIYPDNDCHSFIETFDVIIKKVTEEII